MIEKRIKKLEDSLPLPPDPGKEINDKLAAEAWERGDVAEFCQLIGFKASSKMLADLEKVYGKIETLCNA